MNMQCLINAIFSCYCSKVTIIKKKSSKKTSCHKHYHSRQIRPLHTKKSCQEYEGCFLGVKNHVKQVCIFVSCRSLCNVVIQFAFAPLAALKVMSTLIIQTKWGQLNATFTCCSKWKKLAIISLFVQKCQYLKTLYSTKFVLLFQ